MVDLRRLMPVTLVTLALGVSFSPIVSAQRADQLSKHLGPRVALAAELPERRFHIAHPARYSRVRY